MLHLDGGDLFFREPRLDDDYAPQASRKADLIVDAMNVVGLDAFTPGELDCAMGVDRLLELHARSEFPWVSANLRAAPKGELLFEPRLVLQRGDFRIGITAVTDPMLLFLAEEAPHADPMESAAQREVEALRAAGVDYVIVMAHTSERGGELLARRVPGIDLLCGVHGKDVDYTPGAREKPRLHAAETAYPRGKSLGGRKIYLRDGRTRGDRYFAIPDPILITKDFPDHPAVRELIDAYKADLAGINLLPKEQAAKPSLHFIGKESCATCHPEMVDTWERTAHARAWQTLVDVGQQFDLECVECHSVGIDTRAELSSSYYMQELVDVQCEVCHGQRAGHPFQPLDPHPVTQNVCLKCHVSEHDDDFVYDRDLKLSTCIPGQNQLPERNE